MITLHRHKGLWMYLVKLLLPIGSDESYHLVFLKKEEGLGLITLYVEFVIIHHTKDKESAKQMWDTLKILFGMMNTT